MNSKHCCARYLGCRSWAGSDPCAILAPASRLLAQVVSLRVIVLRGRNDNAQLVGWTQHRERGRCRTSTGGDGPPRVCRNKQVPSIFGVRNL